MDRKIERIIKDKVWGCLADSTSDTHRYERYLSAHKYKRIGLREYWSEKEVDTFNKKIKACFNIKIIIMRKYTIVDVIKAVTENVRNNFNRL